jgi:hypothetical protein
MVAGFGQQLLVAGPPRRFEFAGFERGGQCRARLARVRAVAKPALARERGDVGKHFVDRVPSRPEGQFTQADSRTGWVGLGSLARLARRSVVYLFVGTNKQTV